MDSLLEKILIINSDDNVGVVLKPLAKNEEYTFNNAVMKVNEDIKPGFKLALKNIDQGEMVIKYGEIIGKATTNIQIGDMVHVHNVTGIRAQGELEDEAGDIDER